MARKTKEPRQPGGRGEVGARELAVCRGGVAIHSRPGLGVREQGQESESEREKEGGGRGELANGGAPG